MRIKIWGCRGSIATPGPETLRYGGNTTCVEMIGKDGTEIVIDAGSGARNLGKDLIKRNIHEIYLLFTHAHWDHLLGFPFFEPAYCEDCKIYLCGGPKARDSLKNYLNHQMQAPYFPVDMELLHATFEFGFENAHGNKIGNIQIESILLSHPNGGYGFKFVENGNTFVFLTDNELAHPHDHSPKFDDYVNFCMNADILFHDAQFTEEEYRTKKGWGHSNYSDVFNLAVKARVKKLGFFHHDPDRSDDELDRIVESYQNKAKSLANDITIFAVAEGMEFEI
ncbi:MAG: MBL fold metallo-hydrolase [Verrucomicrobiae bacterium]|nr:MBL fold metallo-hydrolase [Verrucomicrobiae bacterium]